jgi:hypothetical protein
MNSVTSPEKKSIRISSQLPPERLMLLRTGLRYDAQTRYCSCPGRERRLHSSLNCSFARREHYCSALQPQVLPHRSMNEVAAWRLETEVNLAIEALRGVHVRSTQVDVINQMSFEKLQAEPPFFGCTPQARSLLPCRGHSPAGPTKRPPA